MGIISPNYYQILEKESQIWHSLPPKKVRSKLNIVVKPKAMSWKHIQNTYTHLEYIEQRGSLHVFVFNPHQIMFNIHYLVNKPIHYKYFIYLHFVSNNLVSMTVSIDSIHGNTWDFEVSTPTLKNLTIKSLKAICAKLNILDETYESDE